MADWGRALLAGLGTGLDTYAAKLQKEKDEAKALEIEAARQAREDATWEKRNAAQNAAVAERDARADASQAERDRNSQNFTMDRDRAQAASQINLEEMKAKAERGLAEWKLKNSGGGAPQNKEIADYNARSAIADRENLSPDERKAFVTTGKLPNERMGTALTAGDRQAVREADDKVLSTTNTIGMLGEALKLNDSAYSGYTAGLRSMIGKQFGMDGAKDTAKLDNLIRTQALENLKATFGGNPTEGERAILLEIQGSPDENPDVRKDIFQRAQKLVQSKQQFNMDRASELRGGTYYDPKPPVGPPQVVAPQSAAPVGDKPFPPGVDPNDPLVQEARRRGLL